MLLVLSFTLLLILVIGKSLSLNSYIDKIINSFFCFVFSQDFFNMIPTKHLAEEDKLL